MHFNLQKMETAAFDLNRQMEVFELKADSGFSVAISNYGGRLLSLLAANRQGKLENVVLNYPEAKFYQKDDAYFGAIIGRYANRIANGQFYLGKELIRLQKNHPDYLLHGGEKGFHQALWKVEKFMPDELVLSHHSPAEEGGFPGELSVKASFSLGTANHLIVRFWATTTGPTPVNLTYHPYFNLSGNLYQPVSDHELTVPASHYLSTLPNQIPTGKRLGVAHSPFDFRKAKSLAKALEETHPQTQMVKGVDHSLVIDQATGNLKKVARLAHLESGRVMEVFSNQPALHLYTANVPVNLSISGKTVNYPSYAAVCLEPQRFPDAPNHPNFPETLLQPGETYFWETHYRFSVQ